MLQDKSVFTFQTYKPYLLERVGKKGQRKGIRSAMARALRCQPTYISQVLNGSLDFNLEQADTLGDFLGHSADEHHFFLLLVQKARAGTKNLQTYFEGQIQDMLKKRLTLTERLGKRETIAKEDQSIYYSSWTYSAVHIGLTIPELDSREKLSGYLNLPMSIVAEALEFLVRCGLVAFEGTRYINKVNNVRLGNDSHNIRKHHSNWRTKALESLDREGPTELHYSSVFSLSKKDLVKVKDLLLSAIEQNAELVKASGEDELCALCIDFFSLDRRFR